MTALFYAHSGLRYLVLLAGVLAALYFAFAIASGRRAEKPGRVLMAVFTGLLDLQIVLGVILVVSGIYYGALIGHIVMMLLAAAAAHLASSTARRPAAEPRAHGVRLAGVVVALALVAGGVMAIGRDLFGTGVPSVVQ